MPTQVHQPMVSKAGLELYKPCSPIICYGPLLSKYEDISLEDPSLYKSIVETF